MRSVRVRFAPSPTGPLHIGGVRTALYNYLFARKHNGIFILRIEDTDQTRFVPGATEYIKEALEWVGLVPQEGPGYGGEYGPYRQSERKQLYQEHAQQLLNNGYAYYAFDTKEELDQVRATAESNGENWRYDSSTRKQMRNSLTLSPAEVSALLADNIPYVIRLKMPEDRNISFHDHIRGTVSFHSAELDDKVILKTDGLPTYHMANVVDDHHMEISHVIRGEEWLSSTAHHVLMYEGFGWLDTMPEFAHLPLILKPSGKGKLSKRDGAKFGFPVFPLRWEQEGEEPYAGFREVGFDPQAVLNFLAFLGWNPGSEQEIFSLEELVADFSLEGISKGSARFDFDKATWFNQQYIHETADHDLAKITEELLHANEIDPARYNVEAFCRLMKDRVSYYPDLVSQGNWYFGNVESYDLKAIRKKWDSDLAIHFSAIAEKLETLTDWNGVGIQDAIKGYIQENALKFGAILPVLRLMLSGSMQGPDVFEMIALLGKEQAVTRIHSALRQFDQIKMETHENEEKV